MTSDAGLLPYRELDDAVGLGELAGSVLVDSDTGKNGWHGMVGLLRQSVYGRLAGYEDVNDAVRLQLQALACNLGTFLRTLALPQAVEQWSLTTLREKLIKIGAKIVCNGRYVIFQMAKVAVPRDVFADILHRIDRLRPAHAPT